MTIVRIAAVLMLLAIVLAVIYLWKRDPRYLQWAWRIFVIALICLVGLLAFYFVERLLMI